MRRRLPIGLIVPAALVVLVGALAALQYRWLGQVSEAERDELRSSLERRAAEFADDFDREITLAYTTFQTAQPQAGGTTPEPSVERKPAEPEFGPPPSLTAPFERWRSASRFPAIVKDVYYLHSDGTSGVGALRHYAADRDAFDPVEWPSSLELVRTRLAPNLDSVLPAPVAAAARGQVITFTSTTVISEIPAMLVPVSPHAINETFTAERGPRGNGGPGGSLANVLVAMRLPHDYLVLVLDRNVIVNEMLPSLADRHFESDRYRVAIVDQTPTPLLTRGLAKGTSIETAKADVTVPIMTVRPDLSRDTKTVSWFASTNTPSAARAGRPLSPSATAVAGAAAGELSMRIEQRTTTAPGTSVRLSRTGWLVLLQHSAGSLDAAVTQARHRNLWLSFGILSVLVASVGLIVINARRSERLAAQQMDFVATVSHELRTPVTVIRTAAQNLSAGVVQNVEQAQKYGDLIETEGRRLTEMVEQVLSYAGLSDGRRSLRASPADPGMVVHDAIDACAGLLDAEHFVRDVNIAADLPPVMADEDALRRALQNLIGNAVKYAADGRWIGITVSSVANGARREVQIAVSDHGRGIDADDLPHVFEPFYRGRYAQERQIHGNGLGLSLVERIADAHGGRVTVKSTVGQGSTFVLHLPGLSAGTDTAPVRAPTPSGGSIS